MHDQNHIKFKRELADPSFQTGTHIAALEGEKYFSNPTTDKQCEVYRVRNVVAHGDAWRGSEGETGEWSTLTRPQNVVYPALLTLMRTPWLPAVDWTDSPVDLNGLVRLGERRNVVSACVPSGSARALPH